MPLSSEVIGILIVFGVYLAIRLERLDEIWKEIDIYERQIEKEFAKYIATTFVNPYMEDITKKTREYMDFDKLAESVLWDIAGVDNPSASDSGWSQFTADATPSEMFTDQFEYMVKLTGEEEKFEEFKSKVDQEDLENLKSNDSGENKVHDSEFLTSYMVNQELVNPKEAFEESRSIYRRYKWPNRLFALIQVTIIMLLLSILVSFVSLIAGGGSVVPRLPIFISILSVLWIILESMLWYVLSNEITFEERTVVGKFLTPHPKDLF